MLAAQGYDIMKYYEMLWNIMKHVFETFWDVDKVPQLEKRNFGCSQVKGMGLKILAMLIPNIRKPSKIPG